MQRLELEARQKTQAQQNERDEANDKPCKGRKPKGSTPMLPLVARSITHRYRELPRFKT